MFPLRTYVSVIMYLKGERDGSNEYNDYQPGSLNTTDQLIKDLKNIDIVFHIGDITYANGYISQWDQFTAQVEPIASTVPYMIARLAAPSHIRLCYNCFQILVLNLFNSSVETMSGIGQTLDLSMAVKTLEGSVGFLQKQCLIFLLRIKLSSGTLRIMECFGSV